MRYEIHDDTGDLRCVQRQALDAATLASLQAYYPEAADALQAAYDQQSDDQQTHVAASGWTVTTKKTR